MKAGTARRMRLNTMRLLISAFGIVLGNGLIAPFTLAEEVWPTVDVPAIESIAQPAEWTLRCWVRVPEAWAAKEGLLAESVVFTMESVVDVAEVWVNGTSIGTCGSAPPDFRSAREESHRWKVPPGCLEAGKYNAIVIRLRGFDGRIGWLGRAPVLSGYHEELVLAGPWELQADDGPLLESARMARTDRPAQALFENIQPATSSLRRPERLTPGRHLPPAESLASMRVADDLAVDLVVSEPVIAQPLSLDFDTQGRLWVVEYRQYPYPAGLKMVSRDKYYRAVYDQVPLPPPRHTRGVDRISIHADHDRDGTLETHRVFLDGLNVVSSIEVVSDGVWVLHPPYLLFYPDRNHDDVPDGDPEVHLEGFGLEDTHSIANSLTWGPDGWLYGAQGSTTSSHIQVTGSSQPAVYRDGAMVWRYHPKAHTYEVFAEGGGNSFGLEIDKVGQLYTGHNGGNTRGFHYFQGAYYQKGTDDKYGPLSNPFAFGFLAAMGHAESPRFSHDLIKYEENAFPARYRDHLFSIDPMQQRVILAEIHPNGATFATRDLEFPWSSGDFAFRPIDITTGPDGAIYVADFCEEFIAHGQHFQGQLDNTTGRVYRLRPRNALETPQQELDLRSLSNEALLDRLMHPARWHRRVAIRLLIERESMSIVPELMQKLAAKGERLGALECLWVLHGLQPDDASWAEVGLNHASPDVRRWTVRLLGDTRQLPSVSLQAQLLSLAASDPEVGVRAQIACSAQRWPASFALQLVQRLCLRAEDAQDSSQPLLIWWALEKHADDHPNIRNWLADSRIWQSRLVRDHLLQRLMRRYAAGTREQLELCRELLEKAPDDEIRGKLVAGFEEAFAGRAVADLPEPLARALQQAGGGSLSLRIRLGDRASLEQTVTRMHDTTLALDERLECAQLLSDVRDAQVRDAYLAILQRENAEPLLLAALHALQQQGVDGLSDTVLRRMADWSPAMRHQAFRLLAQRRESARLLLEAVRSQRIDAKDLTTETVQQLRWIPDEKLQAEVARIWPESTEDPKLVAQRELDRVLRLANEGNADPYAGREQFRQQCGKCHILYREGGQIGPNLTAYARHNLSNLALQIVQPSLEIREGFETWVAEHTDGRVISGFLVDQDAHTIVIRMVDGQNVRLVREELDELRRAGPSIMPVGLTAGMDDQAVRDLFAYLRLSQPLNQ